MATSVRVPKVEIPTQATILDAIVDALVAAWNRQAKDRTARSFFGLSTTGERQEMILESVLRYSEESQQFVARQLINLGDAIYGGCAHWVS